eukprot:CAMPEP_0119553530 /NCGR_PEP_ID=MMETSP1352-20130426/6269_1 /TAXON_ID=265584 /ORGANISM="Stauroneis constricta, Strain CCMP1120" /LENGTH=403 /DNA_ID=CAMNT_0007599961 /DNA_START=47 /DNA_END=1254 /DNA_ORIENTATION=+
MEEPSGFTIQCQDGSLVVPDDEADIVFETCDYFRCVFQHGMKESEKRVLQKPDWDVGTASTIIKLITARAGKSVPIPGRELVPKVMQASEQILLTLEMFPPPFVSDVLYHRPLSANQIEKIVNQQGAGSDLVRWSFKTNRMLSYKFWSKAVKSSMPVIDSHDCSLVARKVAFDHFTAVPKAQEASSQFWELDIISMDSSQASDDAPWHTLICQCVPNEMAKTVRSICNNMKSLPQASSLATRRARSTQIRRFAHRSYTIRFRGHPSVSTDKIEELVKRETFATVKVHFGSSVGYYLDGPNATASAFTLSGTLRDQLAAVKVLRPLLEPHCNQCSMRVTCPRDGSLQRLIEAVCLCEDHNGTLGLAMVANAYFAVKTMGDIQTVLEYLVGPNRSGAAAIQLNNA